MSEDMRKQLEGKDFKGYNPNEDAQLTTYNLDPECDYVNRTLNNKKVPNLFLNREKENEFIKYFKENRDMLDWQSH